MPYEVIEQRIENAPAARVPHTSTIGVRWVLGYLAWLFIIIMLVWAFAFAVVSPAFASASAVIRASQERGFARLIIGFSELPKFESEIDAGIFVLSFDKTVDVDVSRLAEAIPEYVGQARRDPDGKALRIALTRSYHANIMEAGLELFIDLLPPEWKGLPPPLPAATIKALTRKAIDAARRQAELVAQRKAVSIPYKLKVRLGRHPTFSRIVFQWNKFVTFNLTRTGRRVELKFNKRAKVDLSQARSDPPKFLQNINVVKNPDGMTMHLTVDEDVDIRGFREGLNYVLDLTGPDALAEASAAAVAKKIAGKKKSAGSKKSVPPAEKTEMTVMTAERENSVVVKPVHSKNVRIVRKNIDPGVLSAASFAENKPEEPDISRAANAEPSAKSAGEDDAAQASAQKAREPTSVPPDGAKNAKAQPDDAKNAKVQPDGAKDAKVQPDAKTSSVAEAESGSNQADSPMARAAIAGANNAGASLRFTFQFEKPVAAAVFRRGHSIWSVFDSKARLDLKGLRQAGKGIIEDIKQVHFGDAQYIRITLKKPQLVHVTYSNNGWHLAIGEMASGNTNPLEMVRALRGDKRSLIKIKMKNYGRVHWLTDPEIGDRLA
ncbi:MAG: hypothetical protein ACE5FM_04655, partial [Methyloligellaceae bacterium]